MSHYDWEQGTIALPSTEVTKVKDAIKAASDKHRQRLYDESQRFWKELPPKFKRDRGLYSRAARCFVYGNGAADFDHTGELPAWRGYSENDRNSFSDDLQQLLEGMTSKRTQTADNVWTWGETPPRRVQWPDVDQVSTKVKGANPTIRCGESSIIFAGRKVTWAVSENNHAVEHGRNHPIARAFFGALRNVRWTRGSGGQIWGNDEYSSDSREAGAGANYVTEEFGPHVKPPIANSYRGVWP